MNDYKNDLMKYKLLLIAVTIIATVVNILIIKSSFDSAEAERNEIFVADSQNTLLLALSRNINTNRGNEAKAVVNKMHTHLFYMAPTASDIEGDVRQPHLLILVLILNNEICPPVVCNCNHIHHMKLDYRTYDHRIF